MNNKYWIGAAGLAAFITLPGFQTGAFAGRVESSMEDVERSQRLGRDLVESPERAGAQPPFVRSNASPNAAAVASRDPRIAEYLELHGRAVDGSVRSTMMPWSALQQIAN